MNRKLLQGTAVAVVCLGLAQCTASTTTTDGPPTAFAVVRMSADGVIDTSFGGTGIVVTDVDPPLLDFALAVAIQDSKTSVNDNKIVAAGSDGLGGQGKIALVRYNPDGTLDKAGFGTVGSGIVFTTLASPASASAIALQPDSKILVAALTVTSTMASPTGFNTSITLLRYNTDGSLDTAGFGAPTGFVSVPIGTGLAGDVCALALQPDKNIVVAGGSQNGNIVIARFAPDGTPDSTFAGTGMTTTSLGPSTSAMSPAIALQSDGRIIVAGGRTDKTDPSNPKTDQVLLRYGTNGALDIAFGGAPGGIVITDIRTSDNYANAVAVQPVDDKIVVAGHVFGNGDGADISLVKYGKDGAPDTSFNGTGILTTDLGFTDNAFALLLQTQLVGEPKIVVSGNFGNGGVANTFVRRYNPAGTFDPTFGTNGQITVPRVGPAFIASGSAMALQTTGSSVSIVVAGYD